MTTTHVGDTGFAVNDSAWNTDVPAGVQDNDVLFVWIGWGLNTGRTITPASGWTLVDRIDSAGGQPVSGAVYRKIASSEPASYAWSANDSRRTAGGMIAYRGGFDTNDPVDVFGNDTSTGSGTVVPLPSIVVTVTDPKLVGFAFVVQNSGNNIAAHANMTERREVGTGTISAPIDTMVCDEDFSGTGATGTRDASSGSTSGDRAGILLALNTTSPAPAAPSGLTATVVA